MLKHDGNGTTPEMREYERLFAKIQKTVKMSSIELDDDYSMPLKKAKVNDYDDDEYDDGHKHDYYYYSH